LLGLEPLGGLAVVLVELLDNVGANIAVQLLDALGDLTKSLALTEELLNKLGDAATGNGDVLDGRTNDVAFSDGDDVGHTITRVDDSTGESALGNLNLNY